MSDLTYLCPECRSAMQSVSEGNFDHWECRSGHGMGITLTEAYGHFQEDEIHAIWEAAKSAPPSSRQSPLLGHTMVAVTVAVDDDEVEGNEGPGSHRVCLDVARDEQFLWFHVSDFRAMPSDLANPGLTPEAAANLEKLRALSAERIGKDLSGKESLAGRLGYKFGSRTAAMLHLDGLVKSLGASARKRLDGDS